MTKITEWYLEITIEMIIAVIMTLIITQIIKKIYEKRRVITEETEESKKDELLKMTGRIVGVIAYVGVYLISEIVLTKVIKINEEMIKELVSGVVVCLTLTKGIYTMIHQYKKKENIYEKLKYAEEKIEEITNTKTWIITNKGEK